MVLAEVHQALASGPLAHTSEHRQGAQSGSLSARGFCVRRAECQRLPVPGSQLCAFLLLGSSRTLAFPRRWSTFQKSSSDHAFFHAWDCCFEVLCSADPGPCRDSNWRLTCFLVKLTFSRCWRLCRTCRNDNSWLRFSPVKLTVSRCWRLCGTFRDHNNWLRFSPCEARRLQMLTLLWISLFAWTRERSGSRQSVWQCQSRERSLGESHLRRLRVFRNVTGVVVAVGEDCDSMYGS